MKYTIKDCFWITVKGFKRPQELEKIEKRLMSKLRKLVYDWELDKHTYREVYEVINYWEDLKEINSVLNYELGIKILETNQ